MTAVDASAEAITISSRRTPCATHHVLDLRALPGPIAPGFGIVVAGLSLHYFDEKDTRRAFAAIRDLLAPDGVFAFRVNADEDVNFGATGSHDSWAVTEHDGRTKQFFTEPKICELLAGWAAIEQLERRVTHRFGPAKSLYEVVAARVAR